MRSLSLSIVIIPGIAILLDILLYVFLLRHTIERSMFKRFVITTILLAFFFNVTWEILQMPSRRKYCNGSFKNGHDQKRTFQDGP